MQTSNANQNFSSADPLWVLIGELPVRDFLSDYDRREGLMPGYLFQTMWELGMSPECIDKITKTLAGFAEEALAYHNEGRLEFPGRIRIFCQEKMIGDANSAKTSRPYYTEQGKKQEQIFPDSEANKIAGWGFFMIEQGLDLPPHSSAIPHNYIDLYLYKEGE